MRSISDFVELLNTEFSGLLHNQILHVHERNQPPLLGKPKFVRRHQRWAYYYSTSIPPKMVVNSLCAAACISSNGCSPLELHYSSWFVDGVSNAAENKIYPIWCRKCDGCSCVEVFTRCCLLELFFQLNLSLLFLSVAVIKRVNHLLHTYWASWYNCSVESKFGVKGSANLLCTLSSPIQTNCLWFFYRLEDWKQLLMLAFRVCPVNTAIFILANLVILALTCDACLCACSHYLVQSIPRAWYNFCFPPWQYCSLTLLNAANSDTLSRTSS